MKIGDFVKHPDHKKPVLITEIDGDMIAFTITTPIGCGQYRAWANVATFTERAWM